MGPDDLTPGRNYSFNYPSAITGITVFQAGKYVRPVISDGVLWFWFKIRVTDTDDYYECPFAYEDLGDLEEVRDEPGTA